ncbi:MAG: hypothetical protein HY927_00580 [Elusimicrobia bacterium]|nr:hypothetical protein [Elusimicrobiota bacterium]
MEHPPDKVAALEVLEPTEVIGPAGTESLRPCDGSRGPSGFLRGLAARAASALVLGCAGLASACLGALLTVSIVAAPLGIPLLLLGLGLMAAALFVGLGGGRVRVGRTMM